MGICCPKLAPSRHGDDTLSSKPSTVVPTSSCPTLRETTHNMTTYAEAKRIPRVQLIGDKFCPFTLRVLIALQFKGIHVDAAWLTPEDLRNPNRIITASPNGKYPVLQNGLHRLISSTSAMLDYIEETFQYPTLIPSHIKGEVIKWASFIRDEFTPTLAQLIHDGNPVVQQRMTQDLKSAFAELNNGKRQHGKQGRFFSGSQFTLVDVYLIPTLLQVDVAKFFRGVSIDTVNSHLLSYSRAMHSFPNYAPVRVDMDLLKEAVAKLLFERDSLPFVVMTMLQHRSILRHMKKLVVLADELLVNKLASEVGQFGTLGAVPGKHVHLLWKMDGRLVDLMQEHAQMEERVLFPAIDSRGQGMTGTALTDHARDLPVMNGIREDIKGVMALERDCADYLEGLQALSTRLRAFQENTVDHYHEEERDLLPKLNVIDLATKKQDELMVQCFGIMEDSHGRLLPFLLQGMEPHEVIQYLELLKKSFEGGKSRLFTGILFCLENADEEFKDVCKTAQERIIEMMALENAKTAGS